eukprot:gb/GECG01007658.1/.p1 GENE.gb/GECG01007658.1/~~gb/GECG01007658.1/.p1  ORF type:complete len:585 (+),score=85.24 gb/GECG01007658.1/:1-1755(+)
MTLADLIPQWVYDQANAILEQWIYPYLGYIKLALFVLFELAVISFIAFWATAVFYLLVYWLMVPTPYHTYTLYFNYTEANLAKMASPQSGVGPSLFGAGGSGGGSDYQSVLLTHHLDSLHRSRERLTDSQVFHSNFAQLQRQQRSSFEKLHGDMEKQIGEVSRNLHESLDARLEPLAQQMQGMSSKLERLLEEMREQREPKEKDEAPDMKQWAREDKDDRERDKERKNWGAPSPPPPPSSRRQAPDTSDRKHAAETLQEIEVHPDPEDDILHDARFSSASEARNDETGEDSQQTGGNDELPLSSADVGSTGREGSSNWIYSMSESMFGTQEARTTPEQSDEYTKSAERELKIFERSLETMEAVRYRASRKQLPSDTVRIRSSRDGWKPVNEKEASLFEQGEVSRILSRGQAYEVNIAMSLPLSRKNRDVGNFMLLTELIAPNDETLAVCERPLSIPFEPAFVHALRTVVFAPMYMFGWWEETVNLRTTCFKGYTERFAQPVAAIRATLSSSNVDVTSANLEIRAQLSGISYLLHEWFFTSMIGFFVIFVPMTVILLLGLLLFFIGFENLVPHQSFLAPATAADN